MFTREELDRFRPYPAMSETTLLAKNCLKYLLFITAVWGGGGVWNKAENSISLCVLVGLIHSLYLFVHGIETESEKLRT